MNRRKVFTNIYLDGTWNNNRADIPKSGPGSSLSNTVAFREFFDAFCEKNTVESVLDIGCGDLTWMPTTTTFQTKKYIMSNEEIYNKWIEFINDNKYKIYFQSNEDNWIEILNEVKK